MEDTEITTQVEPKKKNALVEWWRTVTREEWELTVYYPGPVQVLADGSRIESGAPKTYHVSKVIKLSHTHMIFIDTNKVKNEIKLVNPVGYEIKKIY